MSWDPPNQSEWNKGRKIIAYMLFGFLCLIVLGILIYLIVAA